MTLNRLLIFLLGVVIFPLPVFARPSFVTLVNPVRPPKYDRDLLPGLRAQYNEVSSRNLPATWLFSYDTLIEKPVVDFAGEMDQNQEKGIFLEISPNLAEAAGVTYHESGSWHFAVSVFLSGYTQEERIKLIDTAFSQFKSAFGYYPDSVGSWWTDSFSLNYIKNKYNIIANLTCSDQYSTDNYQIWGQYWSTPFYPNKHHSGIPADSRENMVGVVNIQWAPREPLRGYYSSLYSTQDYFVVPNEKLDIGYFKNLLDIYSQTGYNRYSQVTVGLEADLPPEVYSGEYALQLDRLVGLDAVTMSEFAKWYRNEFPNGTPPHVIYTPQAIWYQSSRYRIGIVYQNNQTRIIDVRQYPQNFQEPYYTFANWDRNLSIYIPAIIDSFQNPDQSQIISQSPIQSVSGDSERFHINLMSDSIILTPDGYSLGKNQFRPQPYWPISPPGYIFKGFNIETLHLIKSPRHLTTGWKQIGWTAYLVSQSELDALALLSKLPRGRVLVVDRECLQCSWQGPYKPAIFSNLRQYVSKFGHKPIVYNSAVFNAQSRKEAKEALNNSRAEYIYLASYGGYFEQLPYSPGDLKVEKIFSNANAQIWRVISKK